MAKRPQHQQTPKSTEEIPAVDVPVVEETTAVEESSDETAEDTDAVETEGETIVEEDDVLTDEEAEVIEPIKSDVTASVEAPLVAGTPIVEITAEEEVPAKVETPAEEVPATPVVKESRALEELDDTFGQSTIVASYWTNNTRTYAGHRKIEQIISDLKNEDSNVTSIEVPTEEIANKILGIVGDETPIRVWSTK